MTQATVDQSLRIRSSSTPPLIALRFAVWCGLRARLS